MASGPYAHRRRTQPDPLRPSPLHRMPIAMKEREEADAQGSVSFFHENKTKNGARVLAVSN